MGVCAEGLQDTEEGFYEQDTVRGRAAEALLAYEIHIVCWEGAISRDGINMDRCENAGNLEMLDIVSAR